MGEGGGERWLEIAQTIGLDCSMTHSPGKIEYNCRYFIMTFRTQMHNKKFDKNCFHTLQGTMSHRPLTNTSSLKITAAYCTCRSHLIPQSRQSFFSSRRNWDSPTLSPASECALSPAQVLGEGTHSLAREGLGESQFRRGDIHYGTLYIYVLCASCPSWRC